MKAAFNGFLLGWLILSVRAGAAVFRFFILPNGQRILYRPVGRRRRSLCRLMGRMALHRICGNDRGRRSSRPGRRVRAAGWRTAGPFWGGRYWGRSRRIRLNRSGSCGGMACPRRAGIAYSCGRPAGPMLGRSAGNRPRIPYRDAGRSSSRILRRRRRSLVPCRFRCGPFRTAAVRRCGMLRRTRCAWNSRSSCMGARPIPIFAYGKLCCCYLSGRSQKRRGGQKYPQGVSRPEPGGKDCRGFGVFRHFCRPLP